MREKKSIERKKDLLFTLAEPPTGEYILGGHDAIFYQQGKNWKNKKKLEETYELPRHCAHLCIQYT